MTKLKGIMDYFGEETQLEKLKEETEEFCEAVKGGDIKNIAEEYADLCVVLGQFWEKYSLQNQAIDVLADIKIARTYARMADGYYDLPFTDEE